MELQPSLPKTLRMFLHRHRRFYLGCNTEFENSFPSFTKILEISTFDSNPNYRFSIDYSELRETLTITFYRTLHNGGKEKYSLPEQTYVIWVEAIKVPWKGQ